MHERYIYKSFSYINKYCQKMENHGTELNICFSRFGHRIHNYSSNFCLVKFQFDPQIQRTKLCHNHGEISYGSFAPDSSNHHFRGLLDFNSFLSCYSDTLAISTQIINPLGIRNYTHGVLPAGHIYFVQNRLCILDLYH